MTFMSCMNWTFASIGSYPIRLFLPLVAVALLPSLTAVSGEVCGCPWTTGVSGGQRSYEDKTCQADVETIDDLWYGIWPFVPFTWMMKQRDPPPFSPRRSMQVDDAIVSTDGLISANEESPMDKSTTLTGGMRFLHHRFNVTLNRSVITEAEVYSDAWTCTAYIVDLARDPIVSCDWHYSYPVAQSVNSPAAPSASLPVPLAQSASVYFPTGRDLLNMRVWGATI